MTDAEQSLRWSVRGLVGLALFAAVNFLIATPLTQPEQIGLASRVYVAAADAALAGENFYAVSAGGNSFLYPPVAVVAFVPHALLGGDLAALAIQATINVLAGVALAVVVLRALARRGIELARADRTLVAAFVVVSIYGINQIVMGQVNLVLGLALAAGYERLDRSLVDPGREGDASGSALSRQTIAGAVLAIPAVFKVFPATVGLLLVRLRAWRAVAGALATGLGAVVLGALLLGPDATVYYLTEVLPGRFEGQTFTGTPHPSANHTTVHRQLAALLGGDSSLITPIAVVLAGTVVLALYRRVDTDERRLAAFLGTVVATLLALPLQPLYYPLFVFPLLVLLVALPAGPAHRLLVVGTAFTLLILDFELIVGFAGFLPGGLEAAVVSATETAFTVVLPPTVGMWLILAGCLAVQYRIPPGARRGSAADGRAED